MMRATPPRQASLDVCSSAASSEWTDIPEETLTAHPDVLEAAVIGVEDAEFGQRLKAFVVRTAGSEITEANLKTYVHDRLARFKTPREVVFVDSLPRTATGKIIRRELKTR